MSLNDKQLIKALFETHLFVSNLERSVAFYKQFPGLEQCYYEPERRIAFFWIGKPQQAMLGLWEKPVAEIDTRHFAFGCEVDFILNKAVNFLKSLDIRPYNFFDDGTGQPMVFSWMPAIAIYFDDPDGHCLEFISILPGKARPELGVVSYETYVKVRD